MSYLVLTESWNTMVAQMSEKGPKGAAKLKYFNKLFDISKIRVELEKLIKDHQTTPVSTKSSSEMNKFLSKVNIELVKHITGYGNQYDIDDWNVKVGTYDKDEYIEKIETSKDAMLRSAGAGSSEYNAITTNCTVNYVFKSSKGRFYLLNFTFDDTRIKSAQILCKHYSDYYFDELQDFDCINPNSYIK